MRDDWGKGGINSLQSGLEGGKQGRKRDTKESWLPPLGCCGGDLTGQAKEPTVNLTKRYRIMGPEGDFYRGLISLSLINKSNKHRKNQQLNLKTGGGD